METDNDKNNQITYLKLAVLDDYSPFYSSPLDFVSLHCNAMSVQLHHQTIPLHMEHICNKLLLKKLPRVQKCMEFL